MAWIPNPDSPVSAEVGAYIRDTASGEQLDEEAQHLGKKV